MHVSTDMPHESFMSYLSKFRIWFYNEYQHNILWCIHDNIKYIYRYVLIYVFDVIMNIISQKYTWNKGMIFSI